MKDGFKVGRRFYKINDLNSHDVGSSPEFMSEALDAINAHCKRVLAAIHGEMARKKMDFPAVRALTRDMEAIEPDKVNRLAAGQSIDVQVGVWVYYIARLPIG